MSYFLLNSNCFILTSFCAILKCYVWTLFHTLLWNFKRSESFNIMVTQYKSFTFNYIQNLNTRPYKSFICNEIRLFLNFQLSNFYSKKEKPLKEKINSTSFQQMASVVTCSHSSTCYFILHSQLGSRWVSWSFNKKINPTVFNKHKSSTNKKWIINKIKSEIIFTDKSDEQIMTVNRSNCEGQSEATNNNQERRKL